VRLWDTC